MFDKKLQVTEVEFQEMIKGKNLSLMEQSAIRRSIGLPDDPSLPKFPEVAVYQRRLLWKAWSKMGGN